MKEALKRFSRAVANMEANTRKLTGVMSHLNPIMAPTSERVVDQAQVKKTIRDAIKNAEILSMKTDHGSFTLPSAVGGTLVSSFPAVGAVGLPGGGLKTPESGTVTMTITYRPSDKVPKFNAREVKKDKQAIGKVLKKK